MVHWSTGDGNASPDAVRERDARRSDARLVGRHPTGAGQGAGRVSDAETPRTTGTDHRDLDQRRETWCSTRSRAARRRAWRRRRWGGSGLASTCSAKAVELVNRRLQDAMGSLFHHRFVTARTDIPRRTDVDAPKNYRENKHILYGQQEGRCGGCRTHFEFRHFEVDHKVPRSKAGGDHLGNLQLPLRELQPHQGRPAAGVPRRAAGGAGGIGRRGGLAVFMIPAHCDVRVGAYRPNRFQNQRQNFRSSRHGLRPKVS